MSVPMQIIRGSVVPIGVPEAVCFDTFSQLLNSLGNFLGVEIPASSFTNVIISNVQPGAADKDKLWLRLSNAGVPIGFLTYSATKWVQFLPPPGWIPWIAGNSASPPPGWRLLPDDESVLSHADYAALIAMAIPAGPGPYTYFPAQFTG